jgi:hypothetical protein
MHSSTSLRQHRIILFLSILMSLCLVSSARAAVIDASVQAQAQYKRDATHNQPASPARRRAESTPTLIARSREFQRDFSDAWNADQGALLLKRQVEPNKPISQMPPPNFPQDIKSW